MSNANTEFEKAMIDFKFEFGNSSHIRILEALRKITKIQKSKQGPKAIEDIDALKNEIIWLIMLDF